MSWIKSFKQKYGEVWFMCGRCQLYIQKYGNVPLHYLCLSFYLQFPNKSLLLALCAACIGGTFQYGYNISVINAPTVVIILLLYCLTHSCTVFSLINTSYDKVWTQKVPLQHNGRTDSLFGVIF